MIIIEGCLGTLRTTRPQHCLLTGGDWHSPLLLAAGSTGHVTRDTQSCWGRLGGTASQTALHLTQSQGLARFGVHAGVGRSMGWERRRRPYWRSCFFSFWVQHLLRMVPRPLFRPLSAGVSLLQKLSQSCRATGRHSGAVVKSPSLGQVRHKACK